jgi:hypothetical protein
MLAMLLGARGRMSRTAIVAGAVPGIAISAVSMAHEAGECCTAVAAMISIRVSQCPVLQMKLSALPGLVLGMDRSIS